MGDKSTSVPVVMSASGGNTPNSPATTGKKAAAPESKKPRAKPTHPRTSEMVNAAIQSLKERGGSSLQAIKKYIASTYKIDAEKQASFIKKYLKTAVASGVLVQTKGKGAAGSFRLSSAKHETAKAKAPQAGGGSSSKAVAPKKTPVQKKAAPPKKTPTKKAPPKKVATAAISEKRKVTKGLAAKPPKAKSAAPKTKTIAAKPTSKKPQPKKTAVTKAKKPVPKKSLPKKK